MNNPISIGSFDKAGWGTRAIKSIEDALNFNGEDEAYEELEDDFFSKMIKGELSLFFYSGMYSLISREEEFIILNKHNLTTIKALI